MRSLVVFISAFVSISIGDSRTLVVAAHSASESTDFRDAERRVRRRVDGACATACPHCGPRRRAACGAPCSSMV
ncbi:hypothetical protein B0H14DRAFT_2848433, partial [Mycena olivaceomarginata]